MEDTEDGVSTAAQAKTRWWHGVGSGKVLSAGELRAETRSYWAFKGGMGERVRRYIDRLLPEELKYAERRGMLQAHPCNTLALLVGHSPEPLLQTIGVFEPNRVILLVNRWYSTPDKAEQEEGRRRGDEFKKLIDAHLAPLLSRRPAIRVHVVSDSPDAVFRALADLVLVDQRKGRAVIVDITGAKKSMDAGAFLFAAYADIPISYVDFDDYDEEFRRPLGFACRIGTLVNPYDAFRLREWERLRRLYTDYHFRAAAETLSEILEAMTGQVARKSEPDSALWPYRPEHVEAAQALLSMLRLYEVWDDGDYHGAQQLLPGLQRRLPDFCPPAAVTRLGRDWPYAPAASSAETAAQQLLRQHEALRRQSPSLFESNELLLTYAQDELAKVERLVQANEDNRSALLRAAGLDEMLLKARLVRLWHAGCLGLWDQEERAVGAPSALPDAAVRQRLYDALLNHQGTEHMRAALEQRTVYDRGLGKQVPAYLRLDAWRESYRARPAGVPPLVEYEARSGLAGETLTFLRNQAIHMYLYVTQPIAGAACAVARANVEDFLAHWIDSPGGAVRLAAGDLERLPWEEVCGLCGLGFLPVGDEEKAKV